MKCPACSSENKDAARFCKKCDRDLTAPPAWFPDAKWHLRTLGIIYAALIVLYFGVSAALARLPKPYNLRQIPVEMTPWLAPRGERFLPEDKLKAPEHRPDEVPGQVRGRALALAALAASACRRAAAPAPEARRQTFEGLALSQSVAGTPAWTLRAARAFLHEDAHRADLESPTMDFYRDGKASSRISSRVGAVDTNTHDVRLSSAVVLDSYDDRSHLTTDELLYSSKTGLLTTDRAVVIRRPDGVVRGRGMQAKPDLSEVRIYNQSSTLNGRPQ